MSSTENRAASINGPLAVANASGKTGTHRYDSSISNTSVALPAGMLDPHEKAGRWVRIRSIGVQTDYAFSDGAQTLVLNQTSALGTGNAAAGDTLVADSYEDVQVPAGATHINFISSATGGYVVIRRSEP